MTLPLSAEEAFEMFEDAPLDCHRHCQHWDTDGECCECGDEKLQPQEPILVQEFFSSNPGEDDHSVSVNELGWPLLRE